jgi:hypothetical protein
VGNPGESPSSKGGCMLDSIVEVVLGVTTYVRQSIEVVL